MESEKAAMDSNTVRKIHVVVVPYPSQGHINPMLQFCKQLTSLNLKQHKVEVEATLAITVFINHSYGAELQSSSVLSNFEKIRIETISDGCDEGGFTEAKDVEDYLIRMEEAGSKTLSELIIKHKNSGHPVDCIVYDPFLPWALNVAKQYGIAGAAFFTQMCAVNYIYYCLYRDGDKSKGLVELVNSWLSQMDSGPVPCPGLPSLLLNLQDMPSFIDNPTSYPAYFHMLLNQFCNIEKADAILVNTIYELEGEIVDSMSNATHPVPVLTIGPTIPSVYLKIDKGVKQINDAGYGMDLFEVPDPSACSNWLQDKPKGSVVYVSFGSMANLSNEQMEEIVLGLKGSGFPFLWVIRNSERTKLSKELLGETIAYDHYSAGMNSKGLIVNWSPQLEVLSNKAVGCFFTHCGWNSTAEALCLGVPMLGMPQWTDQPTDAKFVENVWKVGIRVKVDDNGIVTRQEIEFCIREIMGSPRGEEFKNNATHWRKLAIEAASEGGSSHKNIQQFVLGLIAT
uniref:Glycosyltransferase n=1 Tax=Polygala tenuifolia TaxID=355332 RepID=A0A3G3NCU4_9FABA|nr:UDP-glucosyltransferase UGT74AV1 [Polygala tenuifolia]